MPMMQSARQVLSKKQFFPAGVYNINRWDRQRVGGEIEAQEGEVTCPRSHRRSVAELRIEPRSLFEPGMLHDNKGYWKASWLPKVVLAPSPPSAHTLTWSAESVRRASGFRITAGPATLISYTLLFWEECQTRSYMSHLAVSMSGFSLHWRNIKGFIQKRTMGSNFVPALKN